VPQVILVLPDILVLLELQVPLVLPV
jgi:hypothetical protein